VEHRSRLAQLLDGLTNAISGVRPKRSNAWRRAWDGLRELLQVGLCVATIFGVSYAVFQWRKDQAIKLIADIPLGEPFIAQHCIIADTILIPRGTADKVHWRIADQPKEVLIHLAPDETLAVRRCLADHDNDDDPTSPKMYSGPVAPTDIERTLTPAGAAEFARRINKELGYDEQVALMVDEGVADKGLVLKDFEGRICHLDGDFWRALETKPRSGVDLNVRFREEYRIFREFINKNCPSQYHLPG
jgi:hypothetical protein